MTVSVIPFDSILLRIKQGVNGNWVLAHPQFLLPVTVVNPSRGFIRPALRQSGLMLIKDFETLTFLDTHAIKP